jgi:hypothetical protein
MPLLAEIFHQGIREGVFDIQFPDQVGAIFLALIQGLGDAFAQLLLFPDERGDSLQRAERIIAAYNDALERVLGAPAGSVKLMDAESLKEWFDAPGDDLAAPVAATVVSRQ